MEANRFVPLMAALFLVGAGCRTEPGGATKAKHESSTCEAVQSTVLPRTGLHYAARIGDVRRARFLLTMQMSTPAIGTMTRRFMSRPKDRKELLSTFFLTRVPSLTILSPVSSGTALGK